jgi:hypothetical protein
MTGPVVVVTLNFNGRAFLPEMVRSLAGQLEENRARLVVFDNGSTDGSDLVVEEEFGREGWFSIVRSPVNLGFAAGANLALAEVGERIVVLANSDTVFPPGSLRALLDGLERHERAAIAGPRLLWPDGTLQNSLRDFPFPVNLLKEHLPFRGRITAKFSDHAAERRTDWLVGAVMAMRTEPFRAVGGFDPDYFFYHEETDLQYRLHRQGWEIWFVPSSEVIHIEGGSASAVYGRETTLRYISAKLRFLRKHGRAGDLAAFRLLMSVMHLGRAAAGMLQPRRAGTDVRFSRGYCRRALRDLWDGSSGKH